MKYTNRILVLLSSVLTLGFSSCDFLDQEPDDIQTLEEVFSTVISVNQWLAHIYSDLPDPTYGFDRFYAYNTLSDDMQVPLTYEKYGWWSASANQGNWSASSNSERDVWGRHYKSIRSAYVFINNIKPISNLTLEMVEGMKLEARFLIAYFYLEMFEIYGPVPLIREEIPSDVDTKDIMLPRSTVDEMVEWLDEEFRQLAEALPEMNAQKDKESNLGRPTKGAAMACRARLWMMAASPLFNGNPLYAGIKNPDGTNIFPTEEKKEKWDTAASVIRELLDYAETGRYSLYKEYHNGQIDPFLSCQNIFTGKGDNPEIIWNTQGHSASTNGYNFYEHDKISIPYGSGGNGFYGPTQNLIDACFTKNGLPISADPAYSEDGVTDADIYYAQTGWTELNQQGTPGLVVPKGTQKMYADREPRFYTLAYRNEQWYPNDKRALGMFNAAGNKDGYYASKSDYPQCGYLLRKTVHPASTHTPTKNYPYRVMPLFRLGEFYLSYAEAVNESTTWQADQGKALRYLNLIRERAGIPDVETSYGKTSFGQDELREIIRAERRIELACEGKRYTDIRRWMIAEDIFREPIQRMNTMGANASAFYQRDTYTTRSFEKRNYLWPIWQKYIDNNPNLKQNYGF